MHPVLENQQLLTRRYLFGAAPRGLGAAALAWLLGRDSAVAQDGANNAASARLDGPHFAPRAKRVIYLFQSGAPSQMDLFEHKPKLRDLRGTDLPDSIRQGQRLTGMTATQDRFPVAPSRFAFARHGKSGTWLSELLPHTARVVDELCLIKSMHTEAINHDPAITFFQTGAQLAGRPSIGAWLAYGLGSENHNLPTFVAMVSQGQGRSGQPLYNRLWGSGFLPTKYQGVKLRGIGDPVLYLSNPPGVADGTRRRFLDDLAKLNHIKLARLGDPEIATRITQYELAYRMQTSVPELTDISDEPEHILDMYGPTVRKRGTYAANCLLARRMAERGVRYCLHSEGRPAWAATMRDYIGVFANWDFVLSHGSGDFLCLFHSDDLYEPSIVRQRIEVMQAHPQVGAVFTLARFIDENGHPIQRGTTTLPEELRGRPTLNFRSLLNALLVHRNFISAPSVMLRRSLVEEMGGFDERQFFTSADLEMWLRIAYQGYEIAIIEEPLLKSRVSEIHITRQYNKSRTMLADFFGVLDYYLNQPELQAMVSAQLLMLYELRRAADQVLCAINLLAQDKVAEAQTLLAKALQTKYFVTAHHRPLLLVRLLVGLLLLISIWFGMGNVAGRWVYSAYQWYLQWRKRPLEES